MVCSTLIALLINKVAYFKRYVLLGVITCSKRGSHPFHEILHWQDLIGKDLIDKDLIDKDLISKILLY